ncbi:LysR substrate-binding domain-containing protein [Pararhizobium sp. A13]|uniref:LysR substrate-binding domain-containing protein n=1 Tax=Pararhizobium sp. A13 TaxID=3133975 RepID=UPI00311ADE0C
MDDLQDARAEMLNTLDSPRGKLLVTLPTIGYRFLLPVLPAFLQKYPQLELDLDFSDQVVDLIDKGKDVAIRGGDLSGSRFMTRRAGPYRFVICASPEYLERHGVPREPEDLSNHSCLRFRYPRTGKLQDWSLDLPDRPTPRLKTTITSNNMEAVLAAAVRGLGLAYMPEFLAHDAIDRGLLTSVLDDFTARRGDFWIVWPSSQHISPKLRVFIDYMSEALFQD